MRAHRLSVALAVAGLAVSGCRLDPECFGRDECEAGFVCARGQCVLPDAEVPDAEPPDAEPDAAPADAGPLPDLGFADLGVLDLGVADAQRPDLGFPDAGVTDVGFLAASMPAGTNPVVGTSTPTALAGGFVDLQGVTWRAATSSTATGTLLLSDVAGNALYALDPSNPGARLVVEAPSGEAAGTAVQPLSGDLVVCDQAGRRLRVKPQGGGLGFALLTDYFQYPLNSPNDLTIRSDGTIYFTDPPFGLNGAPQDLPFNGLFRFGTLTTTLTAEWRGVPGVHTPDGVALSPDESRLYMTEVGGAVVLVFDVAPSGALTNRRGFATTQGASPNGLAVDDAGNVYVATRLGVEVYADTGFYWGVVPLPGGASDLTFAPPNRQRIYVTTTSTVFQMDASIPGPIR